MNYDEEPWVNSVEKYRAFREKQEPEFAAKLDDAMRILDEMFDQYRYPSSRQQSHLL